MKKNIRYLMTMTAMCGLVGSAVGICMGTAGLFYTAIAEDFSISKGSISMMYTITAVASAFSGLLIPRILRRENRLKLLIAGGVLLSVGGTVLLSIATGIWSLYFYSVIRGIGAGLLSFVLATTVINRWFLAKNGLMVSIAMAFSGLPGVLLSNIFTGVIESRGWRFGYLFVAAVMMLFSLPGLLFPVSVKPEAAGLTAYGYEEFQKYKQENPDTAVVTQSNEIVDPKAAKMVLLIVFTILACIIASVLQHLPGFAVSVGFAVSLGALMTSLASASNILSKLMYGVLTEKIGAYKSTILCAAVNIVSIIMLLVLRAPWAMAAGAFLFGFSFANSSVALSVMTRELFGIEKYTRVYPTVSFAGAMANAVGVTLLGMIYDLFGNYYVVFILCLIMQAAIIVITNIISRRFSAAYPKSA